MGARDGAHVEPCEQRVRELHDTEAEPVAARRRDSLHQSRRRERAELARDGARSHARSACDLVRPELARVGECVEQRDGPLGRTDSAR